MAKQRLARTASLPSHSKHKLAYVLTEKKECYECTGFVGGLSGLHKHTHSTKEAEQEKECT